MKHSEFIKCAQEALHESIHEKQRLSALKAEQFLTGCAKFDPSSLLVLGDQGLVNFLENIRSKGIDAPVYQADTVEKENTNLELSTEEFGWQHLRRIETNWGLVSITFGFLLSLLPLGIGMIYFFVMKI